MVGDFFNPELGAPNVATFAVDPAIADEFASLDLTSLACVRPPWNSDVSWYSAKDEPSFQVFQSAFDRMGIADHVARRVDVDQEVRLYCGLLVVRSRCDGADFHLDWADTGNQAFNVVTPVSGDFENFGLLYRDLSIVRNADGKTEIGIAEYPYRRGEAIMIGDHFVHSTKPGASEPPVVLLSFTCGTDRMDHWPRIKKTAGYQSRLIRLPDGQFETREPPGVIAG